LGNSSWGSGAGIRKNKWILKNDIYGLTSQLGLSKGILPMQIITAG
jgi:hypothetical protein